ncbi:MAG: thioredoxin family protein [Anaerolineales bacterium]
MSDVLLRSGMALGLAVLGYGCYRLLNSAILARGKISRAGLADFIPGRPGILYFTMEGCLPCQTTQRPALEELSDQLGDRIQIIEIDVVARPKLAESWQVLSVPTTVILDPQGEARHINHGVALSGTLHHQLERFGGLGTAPLD